MGHDNVFCWISVGRDSILAKFLEHLTRRVYSVAFNPVLPLSGDGVWQLVILNGWTGSNTISYDLVFEIEGLCSQ